MASNIVDTTIDDTYPVAGIDNDSQGFRDNFNIIKSNFVAAKAELTELQNNAILKNTLTLADWPDAGYARMVVELSSDGASARAITFNGENTAQFKKIGTDSWTSTSATTVIASVTANKEIYEFWTHDGGTNIYAKIIGTFS